MTRSLLPAGKHMFATRLMNQTAEEQPYDLERLIHERMAAGDPPGKIALQLERLKPGAGRAFIGQMKHNNSAGAESAPMHIMPISPASHAFQSENRYVSLPGVGQSNTGESVVRPIAFKPNDEEWGAPKRSGLFGGGIRAAKKKILEENPQIRSNFKRIVRSIVGEAFSERELELIEGEILDNIGMLEGPHFATYPPTKDGTVVLTPEQWTTVRRLISTIPNDELGTKVRRSYREAIESGRLRKRR